MSTSGKTGHKILGVMATSRAEGFLLDMANPPNEPEEQSNDRLIRRYPEVAEPLEGRPKGWENSFSWIRIYLQRAWTAPDDRHRDWYLFELRRLYRDATVEADLRHAPEVEPGLISLVPGLGKPRLDLIAPGFMEPPKVTPFEAIIFYFQTRIGDLAKRCKNLDCNTPYFIADKISRQYCGEKCAASGTRESKRNWWKDNRGKS